MGCPVAHSFIGTTRVLLATGKTKLISRIGVADAVPGSVATESHMVSRVIVTKTDHDFVRMTVKRVGKVVAGTALATALLAGPAQASTLTTTYHHPFYDVTRSAFVDADHVRAGDLLQSVNGGQTEITSTHLFQATTTTYDLINSPTHAGRGDYVFVFRMPQGVELLRVRWAKK